MPNATATSVAGQSVVTIAGGGAPRPRNVASTSSTTSSSAPSGKRSTREPASGDRLAHEHVGDAVGVAGDEIRRAAHEDARAPSGETGPRARRRASLTCVPLVADAHPLGHAEQAVAHGRDRRSPLVSLPGPRRSGESLRKSTKRPSSETLGSNDSRVGRQRAVRADVHDVGRSRSRDRRHAMSSIGAAAEPSTNW